MKAAGAVMLSTYLQSCVADWAETVPCCCRGHHLALLPQTWLSACHGELPNYLVGPALTQGGVSVWLQSAELFIQM